MVEGGFGFETTSDAGVGQGSASSSDAELEVGSSISFGLARRLFSPKHSGFISGAICVVCEGSWVGGGN